MNRLVLIGNGFDLAHGLKTSYQDFINWYWDKRVLGFRDCFSNVSEDVLCRFEIRTSETWNTYYLTRLVFPKISGKDIVALMKENDLFKVEGSTFFSNICDRIEEKGWVDIENEYYRLLKSYALRNRDDNELKKLNEQLQFIQNLLIEYLSSLEQPKKSSEIYNKIYSPIDVKDLSINYFYNDFKEFIDNCLRQEKGVWKYKLSRYGINDYYQEDYLYDIESYRLSPLSTTTPKVFMLPENVMLLTFNYTNTTDLYNRDNVSHITHIHGISSNPESVIFGYGDELDDSFSALQDLGDNKCLSFIKSYKYLDATNYRNTLAFLDSGSFQVYIFGHSCGNSDRTLLNTIFEHKNCISIKPFFYKKGDSDNYRELIQNISRNFTDMKLMRDRVVNKTYCEPLVSKNL